MTLTIKTKYRHTFCLQLDQYDAIHKGEIDEVVVTSEDGNRIKNVLSGSSLKKAWKDSEMVWKGRWPFWVAEIKP